MFGCEIPHRSRGLRSSVHRQQSDPKMKEKAEKLEAGEVSAPVTTSLVEGLCKEEMYRGCLLQREMQIVQPGTADLGAMFVSCASRWRMCSNHSSSTISA